MVGGCSNHLPAAHQILLFTPRQKRSRELNPEQRRFKALHSQTLARQEKAEWASSSIDTQIQ